jgi:ABC-type multidrug transport system fused ATPase/permease subunit
MKSKIFKKNVGNYVMGIILITVILFLVVFIYITSTDSKNSELTDQQGQELTIETADAAEKAAAEAEAQAKATAEAKAAEEASPVKALSAENLQTSSDNSTYPNYLLLIILALLSLISVSISLWLYWWRKKLIESKEIMMVPEAFAGNLEKLASSVHESGSMVAKAVNQQTEVVSHTSTSLSSLNEDIQKMIEIHMKLQSSLNEKDDEIKRLKKGYDADIFHNFLLRFTRVDRNMRGYLAKEEIDLAGLKQIHEVMEDALEECGVESFSPETGVDYRNEEGVEDNPKQIETSDEDQNFNIAEIIDFGYRRKRTDGGFDIITKALVSIYVYIKPEQKEDSSQDN